MDLLTCLVAGPGGARTRAREPCSVDFRDRRVAHTTTHGTANHYILKEKLKCSLLDEKNATNCDCGFY